MTDKLRQAAEMALKALEKATEAFLDTEGSHGQIESEAWHAAYDAQEPLRQALAEWKPDDTAYRPNGLSQDSDQLPDATKMINKDFALNVALEALHNFADDESVDGWKAIDAIGVVRKALSETPVKSYCGSKPNYCEPEMDKQCSSCGGFCGEVCEREGVEPIGEIVEAHGLIAVSIPEMPPVGTKLYAQVPKQVASVADVNTSEERVPNTDKQRHEWQGLTTEQRNNIMQQHGNDWKKYTEAVEQQLQANNS